MKYYLTILLLISFCTSSFSQFNFFNRPPTIDPVPDFGPVVENSGPYQIILTGISPGRLEENSGQNVTIFGSSDNQKLISKISIDYQQGDEAILRFYLVPDANGRSNITITLFDGQVVNNTTEEIFEVRVTEVNGAPSFNIVSDLFEVDENSGAINYKEFALDIDDGDPEVDQKLTFITEILSQTELLSFRSDPKIDKNGTLKFEVNANSYGSAIVSVYLKDDGGTKNGGSDTSIDILFRILVNKTNDPPTIDEIISPVIVTEDSGDQLIQLTSISPGINEDQKLEFDIALSNPALITTPVIEHINGEGTALFKYSTKPNMFGETEITLTLNDGQNENNITIIQFSIQVKPVADTPSISSTSTEMGVQTNSGLIINRNNVDGEEVTHFKITDIVNGRLYLNDGTTQIDENQFVTFSQGNAGLKFTSYTNISSNGSFAIQASISADNSGLGGEIISAVIKINNDPPSIISQPDSIVIISETYLYEVTSSDPDENDKLTYEMVIPDKISFWLSSKDNNDKTATITGVPPENSEGTYLIKVKVIDQFGEFDEQSFILTVKTKNNPPVISEFAINLKEDETFSLGKKTFESWFSDLDGDSIQIFRLEAKPIYGALFFNGVELENKDEIELNDFTEIKYIPERNYFGLDIIEWNASDGKDFAQFPERLNILIESVSDPPMILNFEDWIFEYDVGEDKLNLTRIGIITDEDSKKLLSADINISENYQINEDMIDYEVFDELTYEWQDSIGVLRIDGLADLSVYQQVIRTLAYKNLNSFSPTGNYRKVDIVLHDADTSSGVYTRIIEFIDTFSEFDIPTGFTPNSDGINDTWDIKNLSVYKDCEVKVFSRSGEKIFDTQGGLLEWDGSYNGKIVPSGTYYYFININRTRVFKGTITVLR